MKQFARLASAILAIAVIAGSIAGILHRQAILDYLALRNYDPSSRIVALADHTTMRDNTRRVFYVNHPELDNKTEFNQNCKTTEHSIVLGCYIQHDGIFLLDVKDERLDGVIEVTAAHETLHAEYDRLSGSERKRVDEMTARFYDSLTDERIKKTVELYRSKDASVVPNELHSILGTEVRDLSPELESYYGKYFNNRAQIVDYSEKYEQTFVDLNSQVDQYDAQLKKLKQTIESNQVEIEGLSRELERQKNHIDDLMAQGRTEEYNAAVPAYNAQVNTYNSLISRTRDLINQYNNLVEKRNDIATAEQELIEAINSNIIPKPTE